MENSLKPRVTICLPCYNAERTIVETIESVLAQDYINFDILVCDNASTDKTLSIVKSYESKGVQYIVNSTLKSAEDNWNFLLDQITTEYFCLYHADDLYEPTMVSRQIEFLLNEPVIAVFTMSSLINQDNKTLQPRQEIESSLPKSLKNESKFHFDVLFNNILVHSNFIRTPTLMTSLNVIKKVGKFRYDKFRSSSDLDLWLRISQIGQIGIINDRLHKYRISNSQGSFLIYNKRTEPQDYFKVIEYYLEQPAAKSIVSAKSLHFYKMHKGAELIVCSKNLLLSDRVKDAERNLKLALTRVNFSFAFRTRKTAGKYLVGFFLLFGIYIGLGRSLSRIFQSAHDVKTKRWSQSA